MRRLRVVPLAVTTAAFLMAGAALAACGGDDAAGTAPPPLPTSTAARDAGAPETAAAPPADAGARDAAPETRRWTGTLAQTAPADFGGSPYCKYRMTLKQIAVDVTMKANGEVAAATVTNATFEETVPPCPNPPMKPTTQEFTFASATKLAGGGVHVNFAGVAANEPETSLVLEGPLDGKGPSAVVALEWHRTDFGAPLDWRVTTKVTLTAR